MSSVLKGAIFTRFNNTVFPTIPPPTQNNRGFYPKVIMNTRSSVQKDKNTKPPPSPLIKKDEGDKRL